MSKTVNRRISIFLDSAQGEAALAKLTAQQTKLATATAKLKHGSDEWVASMDRLGKVQNQVTQLQGQLDGRLGPTLAQLKNEQRMLNRQLEQMPVELRAASAEATRLRTVEAAIRNVRTETEASVGWFGKWKGAIAAGAAGVIGGNLVTGALGGIQSYVVDSIKGAAEIADQLADIRKTTEMTADEVDRLNSSLGMIDTRTSRGELREMAKVAGQFGIVKDDIFGFVQAVDKVNVALGDEFGGSAEDIASEISKLRNIFLDVKSDDIGADISHIANALNELGAAGVATGPVVSDFANRIGGIAIPLGFTSGEVLGLSATLQELNVNAERGGTAVGKILKKMLSNTNEFAQVADMNVKKFEDLLNKDLYEAFIKVMEGSAKFSGQSTVLAKLIEDLEINGAGASEVFAKLGKNTDLLREKVNLANVSLVETSSINEEVNIKMNNLAGDLDKLNKKWQAFKVGPGAQFGEWLLKSVNAIVEAFVAGTGSVGMFLGLIDKSSNEAIDKYQQMLEERSNADAKYKQSIYKLSTDNLNKEIDRLKVARKEIFNSINDALKKGDMVAFKAAKEQYAELNKQIKIADSLLKKRSTGEKVLDEEPDKDAEKKAKKIADDFEKLQQEIADLQEKALQATMSKNEAEVRAIEVKYAKLLERAKGHVAETNQLMALMFTEQDRAYQAWFEEQLKAADKELQLFLKTEREKTDALRKGNKERIMEELNKQQALAELALLEATDRESRDKAMKDKALASTLKLLENDKLTAEERKLIWAKYDAEIKAIDESTTNSLINNINQYKQAFSEALGAISQLFVAQQQVMMEEQRRASQEQLNIENRKFNQQNAAINARFNSELNALKTQNNKKKISDQELAAETTRLETEKNTALLAEQERYANEQHRIREAQEKQERDTRRRIATMQKIAAVAEASIQTALLVFKAAAQAWLNPLDNTRAALAGVKLAALIAMPLPQLAWGGSTKNVAVRGNDTGKTYNSQYVGSIAKGGRYSNPSLALVGEEGPELVVPNWLYTHPKMVDTMSFLESAISARQFNTGGVTTGSEIGSPTASSIEMARIREEMGMIRDTMMKMAEKLDKPMLGIISYDQMEDSFARMGDIINKAT